MTKAADQDAAPAGAGRTFRGVIPDTFLTAQANSEEEARQLMVAQLIDLLNRKPEDVIIVYE